jgi:hypothetical protein
VIQVMRSRSLKKTTKLNSQQLKDQIKKKKLILQKNPKQKKIKKIKIKFDIKKITH